VELVERREFLRRQRGKVETGVVERLSDRSAQTVALPMALTVGGDESVMARP